MLFPSTPLVCLPHTHGSLGRGIRDKLISAAILGSCLSANREYKWWAQPFLGGCLLPFLHLTELK